MSLIRNICLTSVLLVSLTGCGGGGGGGGGTDTTTPENPGGTDPTLYSVSVSTSGLTGAGLSVNLVAGSQSDSLSISSDGVQSFGTKLEDGASYSVSVATQPAGQTCAPGSNSSGTIAAAGVTVTLSCVDTVVVPTGTKVRVNVDTLADSETVTLTLNGTETKTFSSSSFNVSFSTSLFEGDTYAVTVTTPPTGKICNLTDATGTITDGVSPLATLECLADVTPTYTIGGSVTGLSGSGLRLKLNGSESVAVAAADVSYAFSTPLLSGTYYSVTIEAHPQGQICSVQNDSMFITSDRTDVAVICSTGPHTIGGTVTGLSGNGLMLSLNGAEDLAIASGGGFAFPTAFSDGMDYNITVKAQPTGQDCTVYRGEGWNIGASQTDTLVECVDKRYEVSVSVSAFTAATPLVLSLNGDTRLEVDSSKWQQIRRFNSDLADGAAYEVVILAQPSGQHCALNNGSGTISGANVTSVAASCTADTDTVAPYTVGVTTSGLLGSGLQLSLNGGSAENIVENGYSTLSGELDDGAAYTVSVAAQPMDPIQQCRVGMGSGTIAGANITNVSVVCEDAVAPLYPTTGARWLDYVKNPAVIEGALADTACEAAIDNASPNACLNGGEYRVIEADYLVSCDGVSAVDNLNAFDWICDSSSGLVRVVSTGTRSGVLLSDLIDFEAVAFKENFVTITSPGSTQSTQPAIWWDNTVRVDNSGEQFGSGRNDIVLVTDNVPAFYKFRDNGALLIQPGFAISGYTDSQYIVSVFDSYYDTNFIWLEGRIDDVTGGTRGGVYSKGDFAVLKNVEVTNTGGTGVHVSGRNSTLEKVTSTGNAKEGIFTWGRNLHADGLTATGNQGTEPAIEITSASSILRNIIASDNPSASAGLRIPASGDVTLENVTANRNGGDGVNMGDWTGRAYYPKYIIRDITTNDNGGTGFFAEVIDFGDVSNLNAHRNGDDGIYLGTARQSPITNINASGNVNDGIVIYRWEQTTVDDVTSVDNGGRGLLVEQSTKLVTSDIVSANNGLAGIYVSGTDDSIWTNVIAANNAGNGLSGYTGSSAPDPNVFLGVTTVNNGGNGVNGTRFERFHFSSLLSAYNLGHGVHTYTFAFEHVFADTASANNGGAGMSLGSDRDYVTGLLTLGANPSGNCLIDTTFITDPGLAGTGGDCANSYNSDAVIVQNADLTSSVVGALATDDTANPDDALGVASHDAIGNWATFDNDYRTWGADGEAGRCLTGTSCRIWDWSIAAGDAGDAGAPALLDVLSLPTTGNETLSIGWLVAQSSQLECDVAYPGSTFNGTSGCTSTYLRHAIEIVGDGIGNDNYLCESNETCLFTPNIGSYQGHGDLVAAGSIGTGGTLTNITLMRYASNGH